MTSMEQSIIEDMSDWDHNMIGGDNFIEIFDIPKSNQTGGSINNVNPEVILIGMGAPQQDFMIEEIIKSGWRGLIFSCGGYFHQVADSNKTNYYPHFINKLNLRWAFRIIKEPKKMIKRYFYDYIEFYLASLNLYFRNLFIKDLFK